MKPSDVFREKAEDIDRNEGKFGGAVVIVPPGQGEKTMDWLIVEKEADLLRFWLKLKTDIDARIQVLDDLARNQQAYRVR